MQKKYCPVCRLEQEYIFTHECTLNNEKGGAGTQSNPSKNNGGNSGGDENNGDDDENPKKPNPKRPLPGHNNMSTGGSVAATTPLKPKNKQGETDNLEFTGYALDDKVSLKKLFDSCVTNVTRDVGFGTKKM